MTHSIAADDRDAGLAAQYEAYPYPERDPQDENRRLLIGSPSHLREVDYWVFGAQRPRSQALRVLVAGCGTGDGAIMLATQLARVARPAEVVCLDRSEKALSIAQARAKARSLDNIRFVQGSLTEPESLELGLFDYIDCCGVLHHLPDPVAALQTLERHLAPPAGMGVNVYEPDRRHRGVIGQDPQGNKTP
ncbi:class I SAM-dependent methyltransferase, partial [Acetobacter sp.]|uniref:class I SAM-dependent methyltransferase n=1 Tax=Acetobacter sp. TaxID=440 RepID=UPI0039E929AE